MNETEINFFALVNQFETEQGKKSEKPKKRKSKLKVKIKKWFSFRVKSKNKAAEEAVEKYLKKYPEKATMIMETDGPDSEETYHQKTIESIADDLGSLFSDRQYEDAQNSLSKSIEQLVGNLVLSKTNEALENVLDPVFEYSKENENCLDGVVFAAKIVAILPSLANSALVYFKKNDISLTSKSLQDYSK